MQNYFARQSFRKSSPARWLLLRLTPVLFFALCQLVRAGNFYAGISPATVPWTNGIVPYEFTNGLTAAETNTYLAALREWELAANVKFVPHTNQPNWILFCYNTNFQDYVSGGGYNPQIVTVASLSRAQVCHEMGHSFGFNHENIRPDATNYITVLTNNITDEPANLHWFIPDPTTVTNGNYDYESVMHLGWDFVSTNPGVLATQQPLPPNFPRYQFRMGNYCLSPGDRAALAYLYPPAATLTNVVTTTADFGPGSLRAAIYYATDHPGTTVKFNIPTSDPGYSNGVFNLHLTGHLPPLVANGMVIDGSTQPGFVNQPVIIVDASQIIPETFTSDTVLVYSSSNQLRNIAFTGFDWNGVTLLYPDATNNTISGCWFGVASTGTNAAPNAYQGILIAAGASGNIIGPTNVISGNSQYGVFITDSNTTGNVVLGNFIGTDFSGSNALANSLSGVFIGNGSSGNIVGGTNSGARNILSGNLQYGVILTSNTTGNVVLGNFIGVNTGGSLMVSNQLGGVFLADGAIGNVIGSTNGGSGNIISGNLGNGVLLRGANVFNNTVQGNFIGTDATGLNPLPNTVAGVTVDTGSSSNLIGGTVAGARNVISGNNLPYDYGVIITGAGTSGNVVEGNYVGPGANGESAISNYFGMMVSGGATGNTFGGTVTGARNVISGNFSYGMLVKDPGTSGNVVEGNYAGLDAAGVMAMPNEFGVIVYNGATNNLIGGTDAGAANYVSGNYYGVCVTDPGTSGNFVEGNFIGTSHTGTNGVGNYYDVVLQNNATGNFIGGVTAGAGNVIAFAGWDGVVLFEAGTTNNSIRGNSIFGNYNLGIDLTGVANDLQAAPVITNAFGTGISTVVHGKLTSTANTGFFIDVYRNPASESQGQFYLGTTSVTTDGSGKASFAYTNTSGSYAGQNITATATAANGDTSQFSAAVPASNMATASAQFGAGMSWQPGGFVFNLTFTTNFSYHIQATTNLSGIPIPWVNLTNFTATISSLTFTDRTATNFRTRFYRVMSP
jgi:Astacin (Peptidase family M12A)